MKLGVIEDGRLKGRKVILNDRNLLPRNVFLVENGEFSTGQIQYSHFCLICAEQVPVNTWCPKCNVEGK